MAPFPGPRRPTSRGARAGTRPHATIVPRGEQRGFTLVELLVTILMIGVLAAVAIQSIRGYLAQAKSAEAMQSLTGISHAVQAAYVRENVKAELLASGAMGSSAGGSGKQVGGGKKGGGAIVTFGLPLCNDSTPVPASVNSIKGKKYQPTAQAGKDYRTGDTTKGWMCIGYDNSSAQHYQYRYQLGGPPIQVQLPKGGSPNGIPTDRLWNASAVGDVDGDGKLSWFIVRGYSQGDGNMIIGTAVDVQDPEE